MTRRGKYTLVRRLALPTRLTPERVSAPAKKFQGSSPLKLKTA